MYLSTTAYETPYARGVLHRMDTPPASHDLNFLPDLRHKNTPRTGGSSSHPVASQRPSFKIDPRRERWEPKEWEIDSYGWIKRRKDEDVGMYSLANEWMGRWKIRRLGFEDHTPDVLKSQGPPGSGDLKPPHEELDKDL
jgi:hypothetical protein